MNKIRKLTNFYFKMFLHSHTLENIFLKIININENNRHKSFSNFEKLKQKIEL
jgi:hypothetical protein